MPRIRVLLTAPTIFRPEVLECDSIECRFKSEESEEIEYVLKNCIDQNKNGVYFESGDEVWDGEWSLAIWCHSGEDHFKFEELKPGIRLIPITYTWEDFEEHKWNPIKAPTTWPIPD